MKSLEVSNEESSNENLSDFSGVSPADEESEDDNDDCNPCSPAHFLSVEREATT